ncbi:MAG: ribulose 1,5-bisphosphate carboxylase small subunit [Betaproteobacteria bacterium RBG_16_64_18]|nr:MAG: ribulose 1,5-bisphosphate carboxylase small subunit [Betaproteobacteria bacterium RBG_16_64_18]OGA07838.1 MAG: ribulose 1,5-bisphosphate carboxylase small subunit [Betaproteobacteria bacterium RIFCSPLOWO2_02_FULL_65_20]OGA37608.1 MAG: ribulose 1,5-bisphosphate carboxylase small subunit [Betaproteobacteria bacterium RIFCSPLOWO2_12_FULL_65_110]
MSEIQEYRSRLSDPGSRRFETFSYLPPMSEAQIRKQVDYIVSKGWNAALEHTEPENTAGSYWYMWKLPMFGETSVDRILTEAAACRRAHPTHHVRLVGYDKYKQTQGTAMVVFRGKTV